MTVDISAALITALNLIDGILEDNNSLIPHNLPNFKRDVKVFVSTLMPPNSVAVPQRKNKRPKLSQQPYRVTSRLLAIPEDMIIHIISFISCKGLGVMELISRRFYGGQIVGGNVTKGLVQLSAEFRVKSVISTVHPLNRLTLTRTYRKGWGEWLNSALLISNLQKHKYWKSMCVWLFKPDDLYIDNLDYCYQNILTTIAIVDKNTVRVNEKCLDLCHVDYCRYEGANELDLVTGRASKSKTFRIPNVIQVGAVWKQYMALTSDGIVYSWGGSTKSWQNDSLGHPNKEILYPKPKLVEALRGKKVIKILINSEEEVLYHSYAMALTDDGEVYVWGGFSADEMRLENNVSQDVVEPRLMEALKGVHIVDIVSDVGDGSIRAITMEGELYDWHFYPDIDNIDSDVHDGHVKKMKISFEGKPLKVDKIFSYSYFTSKSGELYVVSRDGVDRIEVDRIDGISGESIVQVCLNSDYGTLIATASGQVYYIIKSENNSRRARKWGGRLSTKHIVEIHACSYRDNCRMDLHGGGIEKRKLLVENCTHGYYSDLSREENNPHQSILLFRTITGETFVCHDKNSRDYLFDGDEIVRQIF